MRKKEKMSLKTQSLILKKIINLKKNMETRWTQNPVHFTVSVGSISFSSISVTSGKSLKNINFSLSIYFRNCTY